MDPLLAGSYDSEIKGDRLAIPSKLLPEQILTHSLIVGQMCKGWSAELVDLGICFRSDLILVNCVTKSAPEW